MKVVQTATFDTVANGYVNEVAVAVHAEWDMNRFYRTVADNTPIEDTDGYDIEMFPIESITKQNRPKSGINKAVVGQSRVGDSTHDVVPRDRYYVASTEDIYKYWQSPLPSATSGVMTNCAPQVLYVQELDVSGAPVGRTLSVNKISFTVENTYSYPSEFDVQIKTSPAGAWTTVADETAGAIPDNGVMNLWYNGTAWTATKTLGFTTNVAGVRLLVNKMYVPPASRNVTITTKISNKVVTAAGGAFTKADVGGSITGTGIPAGTKIKSVATRKVVQRNYTTVGGKTVEINPTITYYADATLTNSATANGTGITSTVTLTPVGVYFNLISLNAALELNLSADVINTSDSFTMGESDFITPLGNISSNDGSISFMNDTEKYSNANAASPLFGLLDKGAKFTCWFSYGADAVQEFELYSDTWNEEVDQTTVSLTDNTQLFMDTKPPVVLYRNIPVQEVVWRICDIIGFTDYEVTTLSTQPSGMVDIFWTDGEKTAWETFADLARATQTAIYFDAYGKLQIKTRHAAWDDSKTSTFDFTKDTVVGGQPANIITLSDSSQYEANKVTVNWKPTGFSERKDNIIPFEVVWEPEGDVVLRASELDKTLTAAGTIITLGHRDGSTWPAKGIMNIEGEWIAYEGKEYVYYDSTGVRQTTWVEDYDEQSKLDDSTPGSKTHLNHYTGRLKVKERGLYNTDPADHRIDLNNWTKGRQRNYGTTNSPCPGIRLNRGESSVTIETPKNSDMQDYTYMYHGGAGDDGYWYLGTRMKIDKSAHKDKVGGIFFNADTAIGAGYFLEVTATAKFDGKKRSNSNEVMFYSMKADGTKKVYGGERIKMKDKSKNHKKDATVKKDIGSEKAIVLGQYADFDIRFSVAGNGDHIIQVWCVGSLLMTATVPSGSGWQHSKVGRFGLFARGHSSVTFEYVYAVNNLGVDPPDSQPYYDRIEDGYYGTQAADWTFDTRNKRKKVKKKWTKYKQRYNQRFFDDFGPWCHEIRDFDVKYNSDLPSLQAKLYMSNSTQCVPLEFWTTPKAAHFLIANVSRYNAVLSGDDELTAQGNGTINHKLFVYGRPVVQKDAQQIVKTDDWALRRRGAIEVEYDSDWIQNEHEANRFADWLTTHWSRSDSTLDVEVFGNPLIELTDVVHVLYNDIDADYYVTSVSNSFEQGVNTSLTLRKVTRPLA